MLKIALPLGKEPDCMKRITYSLTFILIFITSFALHGEDIRFRTIQESGGLASNHVLSMLRDSNGFMWFGTASGLNRFDGVGMKDMYLLHHEEIESLALNMPGIKRIRFFMTFGQRSAGQSVDMCRRHLCRLRAAYRNFP